MRQLDKEDSMKPMYEAPQIESFTDEAILAELGGGEMNHRNRSQSDDNLPNFGW
jgi:hypothetical protein